MTLEGNFPFLKPEDRNELQKIPDMTPVERLNWAAKIIGNYGKEAAVAFNKNLTVLGDIDLDDNEARQSLEKVIDLISKNTLLGLDSLKWHSHDDKKKLRMAIKIARIGRRATFDLKNNLSILGQIDISDAETRELLATLNETIAMHLKRGYYLEDIMQKLQLKNSTPGNLAETLIKCAEKSENVASGIMDYILGAEKKINFISKILPQKNA